MIFIIFERFFRVFIRVTILAAVKAGIVCPDIAAFDAMAAAACSVMFEIFEFNAVYDIFITERKPNPRMSRVIHPER